MLDCTTPLRRVDDLTVNQVWKRSLETASEFLRSVFDLNHFGQHKVDLRVVVSSLSKYGLQELFIEWALREARTHLRNQVVPKFHLEVEEASRVQGTQLEVKLIALIEMVHNIHNSIRRMFYEFESTSGIAEPAHQKFDRLFNITFFQDISAHEKFSIQINRYLAMKFKQEYRSWKWQKVLNKTNSMGGDAQAESENDTELSDSDGAAEELKNLAENRMENAHPNVSLLEFGKLISSIGWTGFLEECFIGILYEETRKKILRICKGNFEKPLLKKLLDWLNAFALPWLKDLLEQPPLASGERFPIKSGSPFHPHANTVGQWQARLEFHVYESFGKLRISELFDIVTDFPESSPSLDDLKSCLERTHQHRQLVSSLRQAFAQRLLHPGANTSQILDVYISAIKALRLLDSSGVLLEAISEPIKKYLRQRNDTIRCIVTSLTDDSNSELYEELGKSGDIRPIEQGYEDSDDDEDLETDPSADPEAWMPDPIEADPRKTARSRKSNDILSMLVHIYGSKELFVNEYRLMLADKLLSNVEVDTDREVRNLELLKLRFGDSSMHNCEIMVKDVFDSMRITSNIATRFAAKEKRRRQRQTGLRGIRSRSSRPPRHDLEDSGLNMEVDTRRSSKRLQEKEQIAKRADSAQKDSIIVESLQAMIVSRQFWPSLHGENIELHPLVKAKSEEFAHEYSVLKNPRQLVWKTNLGTVNLDLEFNDRKSRNYTVSPLLATIIMHVAEKGSATTADLMRLIGVEEKVIEKKIGFWVNQGIVEKSISIVKGIKSTTYTAVNVLSEEAETRAILGEDEASEMAVSADGELAEEMAVYESYVLGMLNNFDSLPKERIHNVLKMFVPSGEHKYDKTIEELEAFLNKLVSDEKLEYLNGVYQLKKSPV